MPYKELHHTADWCLRVRAENLPELFVEAARGMNALTGVRFAPAPKTERTFLATAPDREGLLVAFLSELVFAAEHEHTAFGEFRLELSEDPDGCRLKVEMTGAPIQSSDKAIKAVTYHNLEIRPTRAGYEVEIVFDV